MKASRPKTTELLPRTICAGCSMRIRSRRRQRPSKTSPGLSHTSTSTTSTTSTRPQSPSQRPCHPCPNANGQRLLVRRLLNSPRLSRASTCSPRLQSSTPPAGSVVASSASHRRAGPATRSSRPWEQPRRRSSSLDAGPCQSFLWLMDFDNENAWKQIFALQSSGGDIAR